MVVATLPSFRTITPIQKKVPVKKWNRLSVTDLR